MKLMRQFYRTFCAGKRLLNGGKRNGKILVQAFLSLMMLNLELEALLFNADCKVSADSIYDAVTAAAMPKSFASQANKWLLFLFTVPIRFEREICLVINEFKLLEKEHTYHGGKTGHESTIL